MRIIIIGGPCCGKSTLARQWRTKGIPTFCSDPKHRVREPEESVTYLPDHLSWEAGSDYVARNWLIMPAPWCCEGVGMVRAVRKLIDYGKRDLLEGVRFTYMNHALTLRTPRQEAMAKAVATIWHGLGL